MSIRKYLSILFTILVFQGYGQVNQGPIQIIFDAQSVPAQGSPLEVEVSYADFSDIGSTQYFILWDSTVMEIDTISEITSALSGLSQFNFVLPEEDNLFPFKGKIRVSWDDFSGPTLPDSTHIFTMRFNVIAGPCSETALRVDSIGPQQSQKIEVISAIDFETNIGAEADDLPIVVPGTNCNSRPVGFNFSSVTGNNGDNICMPLTVMNFDSIDTFGGSVVWDETVLQYTGVQAFGVADFGASDFGVGNTGSGELTYAWIDDTGMNPETLTDGSTLFEVCFDIIGAPGSSSSVRVSDMPNAISVTQSGPTPGSPSVPLQFTTGTGSVQVDSNIPDPLGYSIPNLSGDTGSNVCVPVSVTNFDDINSFGGSLLWNTAVMEFTSIQNFGLATFDTNDFDVTQTTTGLLTYSWMGAPQSLADGATLFEVCYNVIGNPGDSGDIALTGTPVGLTATTPGPGGQNITVPTNSGAGSIRVNNNNTGEEVIFNFPDISGAVGDEVCIPLTVDNFTDIIAVNGSITWDSDILNFSQLGSLNLPGLNPNLFNLINAGNGVLTFVWSDPTNTAQTLANGSTILELCFTIACDDANNNVSIIRMSNTPTSISVGQQPDPNMPSQSADVVLNDGSYTVTSGCGGGTGGDRMEFFIPDLCISPGTNSVCVPLTANNFIDVQQLDFSYMWDPTVLTYSGVANPNLGGFNPNTMVNPLMAANGKLTFAWIFDPSQGPETVPNGGTIIEFCFDVIGSDGDSSPAEMFSGQGPAIDGLTPIAIGVGPADEPAVSVDDYVIDNGSVAIGDKTRDFHLTIGQVTGGPNGVVCVPMTVEGFDNILLNEWHYGFDQTELCFNSIRNINPILDVNQNTNFDLRAPGQLLYSWTSPDGATGFNIPDGEIIHEVCFDVKAGCDETAEIALLISGSQNAVYEVVNATNPNDLVPASSSAGSVTVDCPDGITFGTADIENVRCNGETNGSITVNFSGGTPPFTCSWDGATPVPCSGSSTRANLGPGAYTLTIMDNAGASISQAYSVSEPDPIRLNATVTDVTCDSSGNPILGSIILNPSGGTGQLEWDDLLDRGEGTYRVEVSDANGCSVVEFFDIEDLCEPVPKDDFSITILEQAGCGRGGRIRSNGPDGATVRYEPGIGSSTDDVAPGTYTAICELNGQTATFRFTITNEGDGPAPRITNIRTTDAPCEGQQGGFVDYDIVDGCEPIRCGIGLIGVAPTPCDRVTALIPGDYIITIEDNIGRVDTQYFSIVRESGDPVMGSASMISEAGPCIGDPGSVFLEASGGCGDLTCKINANNFTYGGPCNQTLAIPAGDYILEICDESGTTFSPQSFTVPQSADTVALQGISVDASSCTVGLDLSGGTMPYGYVWLDAMADTVSTDATVQLDPDNISAGYFVTVIDGNGCQYEFPVEGMDIACDTISGCDDPTITVGDFTGGETSCADDQLCSGTVTGIIQQCEEFRLGTYTLTLVDQSNNEFSIEVENSSELLPFMFEGLCAGSYVLTITELSGDDTVIAVPVQVIAPEPIEIVLEDTECDESTCLSTAEISITGGVGGYDISWMDGAGNILLGPILEADSLVCDEDYQVEVMDGNGCVTPLFFQTEDCGKPPCMGATPVITPNGDGLNDNLEICSENGDNTLSVYDRWGRLVHNSSNYNDSWSGTDMDGERLIEGAYYWVLEENNPDGTNILKGTVTILRNQP